MRFENLEVTIQNIIDECNHEQSRVDTVLMGWRGKLKKEPTLLPTSDIDKIMREVQRRLSVLSG